MYKNQPFLKPDLAGFNIEMNVTFRSKNGRAFIHFLSRLYSWFDIEKVFKVYRAKNVTHFFVIDWDFEEFKVIFFIILCFL